MTSAARDRDQRGDKSIPVDSLYKVSEALQIPLRYLADVRPGKRPPVPSQDAEKIFALVSGQHRRDQLRRAHEMVRSMLGKR